MPDSPPLCEMSDTDLTECTEHVAWLLEREKLLPRELFLRLDTWRVDMQVETEDRAAGRSRYMPRI
jgi:hypothetical protein